MRRTSSAAGSWGLVLAMAASARAGDDGPPPLTTPAEAPIRATQAPGPVPRSARASTSLLRPRATRGPTSAPPAAAVRPLAGELPAALPADRSDLPPSLDGPPPLVGPSEMGRLPERLPGGPGVSRRRMEQPEPAEGPPTLDAPPTLTLEPEGGDGLRPLPPALAPEPADDGESDKSKERGGKTPPRRRFGLLPGPFSARARRDAAARDPAIRVEPRSDPAADAALKRKLEAKVKDAVGDRARDVEVNVVDRNVVVRARVDRIWNRRTVRRTIEGLPALSGYKARVEIND